ncbi:DUF447 domain-containing protein [Planctomicrobium sp. SH527]|uniref:DUF447 domain-containing protein n=1 Tax=Planctomicrobium sp. SH527 TaxID=3448123 RepID=UPI003F5C5FD0
MILEGLCTTKNADGTVNIAPMGPIVDAEFTTFHFRPFQTSTTYANLKRTGCGVFHVTDDVELIAHAAVGRLTDLPELKPATKIDGAVITGACRWFEFQVVSLDDSQARTEIDTRVIHTGHLREFFGFNRAKHAVLEAAILCTRLHLIPAKQIVEQFAQFKTIIDKTAGPAEIRAFEFLTQFLNSAMSGLPSPVDIDIKKSSSMDTTSNRID